MKSRLLGGLVALVLAIVGTVLLVNYVGNADRRAQQALDPVDVVVVEKAVPAGTKAEDLTPYVQVKSVPGAAFAPGALSSLADTTGQVTAVDLQPGEQLLGARLVNPTDLITPGAVPVPAGMQEVTVVLPPESVVGGTLRAGDLVGIYVTMAGANASLPEVQGTQLVFDKVLVTSIQQAPPAEETAAEGTSAVPSGSAFVTFARNAVDAAKVIHSAQNGSIWLTKQSAETPASDRTIVTTSGVFQ